MPACSARQVADSANRGEGQAGLAGDPIPPLRDVAFSMQRGADKWGSAPWGPCLDFSERLPGELDLSGGKGGMQPGMQGH